MAVKFKRCINAFSEVYNAEEPRQKIGEIRNVCGHYAYIPIQSISLTIGTIKQIYREMEYLEGIESDV